MEEPFFTLITCSRNSEKHLQECLDSAEKQIFRDFEHVFVEGKSLDKTENLIKEYKRKTKDIRVKFIKREPKGISDAFNHGIKQAKGKYLIFLNSDDYLTDETSLARIHDYLVKHQGILWLQGNLRYQTGNKVWKFSNMPIIKPLFKLLLSLFCPINHQNTVMSKKIFEDNGLFLEDLSSGMDRELFIRLLGIIDPYFVDQNFVTFRIHSGSKSSGFSGVKSQFYNLVRLYEIHRVIPFITGLVWMYKYDRGGTKSV